MGRGRTSVNPKRINDGAINPSSKLTSHRSLQVGRAPLEDSCPRIFNRAKQHFWDFNAANQ
eukprot:2029526-Pyramimonas_sp.AAC.1